MVRGGRGSGCGQSRVGDVMRCGRGSGCGLSREQCT